MRGLKDLKIWEDARKLPGSTWFLTVQPDITNMGAPGREQLLHKDVLKMRHLCTRTAQE